MFARRKVPEGFCFGGATRSSETLVFSPRMSQQHPVYVGADGSRRGGSHSTHPRGEESPLDTGPCSIAERTHTGPAGYFESWDVAIFGDSDVFLLTLGTCASRERSGLVSFARAETIGVTGAQRVVQLGTLSPMGSDGDLEVQVASSGPATPRRVAYSAGRARFELSAFRGGEGTALLGPWGSQGRICAGELETSWEGKLEAGGDENGWWHLVVPQLPIAPRRWVCFASAATPSRFTGEFVLSQHRLGQTSTLQCSAAPALLMRAWGSAHPRAWARITGIFDFDDAPTRSPKDPSLLLSGAWIKMGRLGVLGPPVPKTFFVLRFSKEEAARLGIPQRTVAFNALPRAVACSSYVRFPRWESRLISRHLVATVSLEVSGTDPYQFEVPDPEEAGIFAARFPFISAEVILETKSKGMWRHAATARPSKVLVEFGGREPLPYLALLPKEYALGIE